MEEIWRDVKGFEGLYEVSNFGTVRSLFDNYGKRRPEPKILKPGKNNKGYLYVCLCKNGKAIKKLVHRIAAEAFLENPLNLPVVNHRDENPLNNRVDNLEFCTQKYNVNYGTGIERMAKAMKGKFVNRPDLSKRILQYDLSGNLVQEWLSIQEVSRQTGWSHGSISMTCNGKRKTSHGFVWRYAE